ncbi:MAG: DinB family protein [Saprospiraceae bacterium]|nr:DinB family protein [Saprospiraceae bacterium]
MEKKQVISRHQRYRQQLERLFEEMRHYDAQTLNRHPVNGGWSAIQTMHHLILTEEKGMEYIVKKAGFGADFQPVNAGTYWRGFLLWAYLVTPFKFSAPAIVSGENLPDFSTLDETKQRWLASKATWDAFFEKMPDEWADKMVYKHPRAGKIGWAQMFSFWETHLDRHLGQIREALK